MSNFNQYFRNQGAKLIVDKFFSGVDMYNPEHKLTDLKWYIEDGDNQPASYFIENGLTASHKVWSHWHMTTCELHEPVRQGEEGHTVPWGVLSDKILTGVCIGCTQEGSVTHDTCKLKTSSDGRQHYSITTCNSHEKVKYDSVDCTRELKWGDAMHWYETTCPEHGAARSAMESCTFAPGYQYDEMEHWWITDCKDEKKNPKHDSYEYGRSSHAFDDAGKCVCGFSRPQDEGVLS